MSATAFQRRRRTLAKTQKQTIKQEVKENSLADLTIAELKNIAKSLGLTGYSKLKEVELIEQIEATQAQSESE